MRSIRPSTSTRLLSAPEIVDLRAALEADYQAAYGHAQATVALLKGRLRGGLYYAMVDIGNMVMTFDENYHDLLDNLETDYTLYLTVYERYLQRLKGYIESEIRSASEDLTVQAKGTYDQFFERLCEVDLLHIDDLGAEKQTEWVLEQLYAFKIRVDIQQNDSIIIKGYTGKTSFKYAKEYRAEAPAS